MSTSVSPGSGTVFFLSGYLRFSFFFFFFLKGGGGGWPDCAHCTVILMFWYPYLGIFLETQYLSFNFF